MSEAVTKIPRITPLVRSRLSRADHMRLIHVATTESGTEREDLLKPEYWKLVSPVMNVGDRVEVYAEDGTYFAELLVRACGSNYAAMAVLRWHELDQVDDSVEEPRDFEIKYGNRHTGWRVTRLSDNEVVQENLPSREAAEKWTRDYRVALSR